MNQKPVSAHMARRLSWPLRINNGELMMAVNGTSRTCTQPKRALDMCTRGSVLSSRPFSSVCDSLWCAWPHCLLMFTPLLSVRPHLCVSQHQAVLSASLLRADSRDHHNLRWEAPPYNYVLSVTGQAVLCAATCSLQGGVLYFFTVSGLRGPQCTLTSVSLVKRSVSVWLLFSKRRPVVP